MAWLNARDAKGLMKRFRHLRVRKAGGKDNSTNSKGKVVRLTLSGAALKRKFESRECVVIIILSDQSLIHFSQQVRSATTSEQLITEFILSKELVELSCSVIDVISKNLV